MDLQLEELESVTLTDVVHKSVSIPRSSPQTFALITLTLTLVFPLSFAILAHTLFTRPILHHLQSSSSSSGEWSLLFFYQFIYLLFLFTFSLLSTAAVIFTIASLYATKPVSFRSTLAAIRLMLPHLLRTFLWVALITVLYNLAFTLSVLLLLIATHSTVNSPSFILSLALVIVAFLATHVYISALWHLASIISILKPICGLEAMAKSCDLLRGRTRMAASFIAVYSARVSSSVGPSVPSSSRAPTRRAALVPGSGPSNIDGDEKRSVDGKEEEIWWR